MWTVEFRCTPLSLEKVFQCGCRGGGVGIFNSIGTPTPRLIVADNLSTQCLSVEGSENTQGDSSFLDAKAVRTHKATAVS